MSLNIDFAGGRFHTDMATGSFSNCHVFSLTVTQILLTKYPGHISPAIRPWAAQLQAAQPNQPGPLRNLYTAMGRSGQMTPLLQNNCMNAAAPSLVLFFDLTPNNPQLQHSMLIRDTDEWIGANNLGSLSISTGDYSPLGPSVPYEDVWCFPHMSQRNYIAGSRGGWVNGQMAGAFSGGAHSHNLLFIPIVV